MPNKYLIAIMGVIWEKEKKIELVNCGEFCQIYGLTKCAIRQLQRMYKEAMLLFILKKVESSKGYQPRFIYDLKNEELHMLQRIPDGRYEISKKTDDFEREEKELKTFLLREFMKNGNLMS